MTASAAASSSDWFGRVAAQRNVQRLEAIFGFGQGSRDRHSCTRRASEAAARRCSGSLSRAFTAFIRERITGFSFGGSCAKHTTAPAAAACALMNSACCCAW